MRSKLPRLMIAAPHSGCGKTLVTCALLTALARRGMRTAAFKCGPDYIDPMFHARMTGVPGENLDLYFTEEKTVRALLREGAKECDIAVLEGVMGYYDGAGGTDRASSYHLASATGTPVLLVIAPGGQALTLAAELRGIRDFRADSNIAGVLLNRCSPRRAAQLREMIERECGIPVIGFLPTMPEAEIESRYLGLVTAGEIENLRGRIAAIADQMEQTCALDAICGIAATAPAIEAEPFPAVPAGGARPRIAIARDAAFSFLYADNLRLMEQCGAQLCFFSPLADEALPERTDALYLPGGYPELYARQLSQNRAMREQIARAVKGGLPTVAECGGFLYLHEHLADPDGNTWPMAGVIAAKAVRTEGLRRFGYITLCAKRDCLLLEKGERMPAHEFHHWESGSCGEGCSACRPDGTTYDCVHAEQTLFAGFPHLLFRANPRTAERFVRAAAQYQKEHSTC